MVPWQRRERARTARERAGRGSRCSARRSGTRSRPRCTPPPTRCSGSPWEYSAIEVAEGGRSALPRHAGRVLARSVAHDAAEAGGAAAAGDPVGRLVDEVGRREHRRIERIRRGGLPLHGFNTDVGGIVGALADARVESASTTPTCSAREPPPRRHSSAARELGAERVLVVTAHAVPRRSANSCDLGHAHRRRDRDPAIRADRCRSDPSVVVSTLPGGRRAGRRPGRRRRRTCCSTSATTRGRVRARRAGRASRRHRGERARHAAAPGDRPGAHLRHRVAESGELPQEDGGRRHAGRRRALLWKDREHAAVADGGRIARSRAGRDPRGPARRACRSRPSRSRPTCSAASSATAAAPG